MWEQFISLVDGPKLIAIMVLVLVDFVLGIIVAIKKGEFQFEKIANFLNTSVLAYIGGYFLLGLVVTVHKELQPVLTGAYVALDAALIAGVLGKLKSLGIPIPDIISRK